MAQNFFAFYKVTEVEIVCVAPRMAEVMLTCCHVNIDSREKRREEDFSKFNSKKLQNTYIKLNIYSFAYQIEFILPTGRK